MSFKDCTSPRDTNNTGATIRRQKRRSSTDRSLSVSHGTEVKIMLDSFRADINKSFVSKRKCLESFTSQQKIEALWRSHQRQRAQVCDDYSAQFSSVFQQWENDMQRNKDQNKNIMGQQIMFQQMRASQTERLKMLKEITYHYIKRTQQLQDVHEEQNIMAMSELHQKMALLQKKTLMNTQQEQMTLVRSTLQSLLM